MEAILKPHSPVEFLGYESIEPKDLLSFTHPYIEHISSLRNYLIESQGKEIDLVIARIDEQGNLNQKIISGRVNSVENNQFQFLSSYDLSPRVQTMYEPARIVVVRFDNVLGNIPLMPSIDFNRLKILQVSPMYKRYLKSLAEMKTLLTSCIGRIHVARLYYYYDTAHSTFRQGNYSVEAEILKVNKSNVLYNHIRTMAWVNPDDSYVKIGRNEEHDRFIAGDRYLRKVSIIFEQSTIGEYDNDDY